MNLSNNVRVIAGYQSTAGNAGTTGFAVTLSTAGSTGTGATTSGPGGYPFATTGFDMRGYEGVIGILAYASASTGGGAGTSGINTLQYYAGISSTSNSTEFTALKDAYVTGYSTGPGLLILDVVRPKTSTGLLAGQFQAQVASSSNAALSITVITYGGKLLPTTNSTAQNTAATGAIVAGSAVVTSPGT